MLIKEEKFTKFKSVSLTPINYKIIKLFYFYFNAFCKKSNKKGILLKIKNDGKLQMMKKGGRRERKKKRVSKVNE